MRHRTAQQPRSPQKPQPWALSRERQAEKHWPSPTPPAHLFLRVRAPRPAASLPRREWSSSAGSLLSPPSASPLPLAEGARRRHCGHRSMKVASTKRATTCTTRGRALLVPRRACAWRPAAREDPAASLLGRHWCNSRASLRIRSAQCRCSRESRCGPTSPLRTPVAHRDVSRVHSHPCLSGVAWPSRVFRPLPPPTQASERRSPRGWLEPPEQSPLDPRSCVPAPLAAAPHMRPPAVEPPPPPWRSHPKDR
mmetsp:Transcript_27700/g.60569  ORF Transcript_27700/g.60569 Transcript_27700/m.60569 type:complete len:252 (+) Transcript_27700:816-1571(+)